MKYSLVTFLALLLLGSTLACRSAAVADGQAGQAGQAAVAQQLYTSYNIWYEHPNKVWGVNYRRGHIIPVGTKVAAVTVRPYGRKGTVIRFRLDNGARYQMIAYYNFHPGLSGQQFVDRLFTPQDLDKLSEGLTEEELAAVKGGRLVEGMSRKAVILCCGYPPEHKTPSLNQNVWYYWDSRVTKKAVYFDEEGKTTARPVRGAGGGDEI